MKYILTPLLLCLTMTGCAVSNPSIQEPLISFRGLVLGSAPLPDMQLLDEGSLFGEITDTYINPSDQLRFGNLPISQITYRYFDQKLYSIELDLSSPAQSRCPMVSQIISALSARYAISMTPIIADYSDPFFLYSWTGSEADISYMCMAATNDNAITIESIPLRALVKELEDEAMRQWKQGESELMMRSLE